MEISEILLHWYSSNKRPLPWRKTKDPYLIWLSEIILQQTRVDQGIDYYRKFRRKYPTVAALASSSEEEVLRQWQGLGYYSRARNLHYAANEVVTKYGGKFPETYEEILSLKGIGKYSAAAIGSIAYELPYAVLDGNVYRVLSRLFGIETPIDTTAGRKEFEKLADELMPQDDIGDYNQAIMEFGALQCVPVNPDCENCVLKGKCLAYSNGNVSSLPVKQKKLRQRDRYFHYLVIRDNDGLILKKRSGNDIWKNMYDFPMIENENKLPENEIIDSELWNKLFNKTEYTVQKVSGLWKHILSHQKVFAEFWEIKSDSLQLFDYMDFIYVKKTEIQKYPLPKLIENYLESKS